MRGRDYPAAYGSVQNALAQSVLCLKIFQPFFGNDQYVFDKPESACEYCSRIERAGRVCLDSRFSRKRVDSSVKRSVRYSSFFLASSCWIMSRERSIHPVDFHDGDRLY